MMIQKRWTDFLQGSTRLDLRDQGRSLSHIAGIVPFTLHFGAALVRADAVAGIGTEEDCRRRGYASQVMGAALAHMAQGDAGLSFLHGIRDFYHRFGYVPAGPSYEVSVGTAVNGEFLMPQGCRVRPGRKEDLPAIQALYHANALDVVGAAVRPPGGFVWTKLSASLPAGECRVVEEAGGRVIGYAWLARACWAVRAFASGHDENAFTVGEVMAADQRAAAAVIVACRAWAEEEGKSRGAPIHQVCVPQPPVGPVAAALRFQHSLAQQRYKPSGGFMARVISVDRLLAALAPELRRRVLRSSLAFSGVLTLRTDIGEAALTFSEDAATENGTDEKQAVVVDLPQTTLVRLLFGAMNANDILDHDGIRVDNPARQLLGVLFPPACPHVYLPDHC